MSAVAGGDNDPTLLTLMAPRCPKAALTSKQGSHSYCHSNNENGSVKTNSKKKLTKGCLNVFFCACILARTA